MQLSPETAFKLATLAYADWAEAFDTLKACKEEADDGTPDFAAFQSVRLLTAKNALRNAEAVWHEATAYSTFVSEQAK